MYLNNLRQGMFHFNWNSLFWWVLRNDKCQTLLLICHIQTCVTLYCDYVHFLWHFMVRQFGTLRLSKHCNITNFGYFIRFYCISTKTKKKISLHEYVYQQCWLIIFAKILYSTIAITTRELCKKISFITSTLLVWHTKTVWSTVAIVTRVWVYLFHCWHWW